MFEGKPPRPHDARALDPEQHDFETLRPLSWGDLVARFSAARELRSSCDETDECGEASFLNVEGCRKCAVCGYSEC